MNKFTKIFPLVISLGTSVSSFNNSVNAMIEGLCCYNKFMNELRFKTSELNKNNNIQGNAKLRMHHPSVKVVHGRKSLEELVEKHKDEFYGETIFKEIKKALPLLAEYIDVKQFSQKIGGNEQVFLYLWNAVNNRIGKSVQQPLKKHNDRHYHRVYKLWLLTDKLNNPVYLFDKIPLTRYLQDTDKYYDFSDSELNFLLEDYCNLFSIEYVYFPQDDLEGFTIFLGDYIIYIACQPDPTKETNKKRYNIQFHSVGLNGKSYEEKLLQTFCFMLDKS